MIDLPDAPWIREAEAYGLPETKTIRCPVCGAENPKYFIVSCWGEAAGCSQCSDIVNAYEWTAQQLAKE